MWFLFALITLLFWSCGDAFSKSVSSSDDKMSHWKIVISVGIIMGIHAVFLLITGNDFQLKDIIVYLPVSFFYILSMILGYVGLRYLAVSILSPVSNASGAVVCIMCLIFIRQTMTGFEVAGTVLVTVGIVLLSIIEQKNDKKSMIASGETIDKKFTHGALALIFPILYCIFDALGTFADALVLDEYEVLSEESALISYELTFFLMALYGLFHIYVIRRQKLSFNKTTPRLAMSGICETAGQITYVYAMASDGKAVVAAPLISCYCLFSMLWARIFLKEKLTRYHYFALFIAVLGILSFGISDGLAG